MTKDEALFLLKCHAFHHDDIEHEKMTNGFLGMLRPFRGELIEDNFHELMKIIEVLADEFAKPQVNRILISCFWSICQLSRAWALYPDGMLQWPAFPRTGSKNRRMDRHDLVCCDGFIGRRRSIG